MAALAKTTVWQAFYDILRAYDMKTMFGNPGSTEQPMLKNFPSDFKYVFGLQEATVVGMADGYSQATRKPVVVSLHGAAGNGNAMGCIFSAYMNKTPLLLIAGQQHREMLIGEPYLTSREATTMPKPYVKWAYQPVSAAEVPAAVIRAITTALLPPMGPVHLTIPLDDWAAEVDAVPIPRFVSSRTGPDPERLAEFADKLRAAKNAALVLGPEVDRSLGWDAAVKLAELLDLPVYQSPGAERAVFPELHPLFRGPLPMAELPLSETVAGHDLLFVIGAEIWRYYPYIKGPVVPPGTTVLQITEDPHDASSARAGDSLISNARLALEALVQIFAGEVSTKYKMKAPTLAPLSGKTPMTALDAFTVLARNRPDAMLLQESPSNAGDLLTVWPALQPERYMTMASGQLGWDGPAAVGVAIAQKQLNTGRPTVLVIGDGSFNYSVQFVYTAVHEQARLIIIVPRNEQYAILKEFGILEEAPNVPALDLHNLDAPGVAKGYGCPAYRADTEAELEEVWKVALAATGPVLIEVPINRELRPLVAKVASHPR